MTLPQSSLLHRSSSHCCAALCIFFLSQLLNLYLEHENADHFLSNSLEVEHGGIFTHPTLLIPWAIVLNNNGNHIVSFFVSENIIRLESNSFKCCAFISLWV